jgi:hypothetical protein
MDKPGADAIKPYTYAHSYLDISTGLQRVKTIIKKDKQMEMKMRRWGIKTQI